MAKAKKVVVKAVRDDVTAKDAMLVVGKPLAQVNKRFDELASLPTEGAAQRGMCAAMFAWGLAIKATGKKAFDEKLYADRFDGYVAKHWKPHERPGQDTLDGYKSQYGAFAQIAFAPYNATEVVRECVSIANVQMPWRAARMREFAKLTAAPSKADIAKTLTITKGAGSTVNLSGDTAIERFISLGVTVAGDRKVQSYLDKTPAVARWLRPILQTMVEQREGNGAKMKAKTSKAAVEQARKFFPVSTGRGSRVPRGATIN